jgi:serine/threonine protein phosphatase 1
MDLTTELERRFPDRVSRINPAAWEAIYVVGDVHGCTTELRELLETLRVSSRDLVICVGDVLGKGPDSPGALAIVEEHANVLTVLGNGDASAVREGAGLAAPMRLRPLRWPLAIAWDREVVVHAGVDPRRAIASHLAEDLLETRSLMHGSEYRSPYWFEEYDGDTRIFFGHTVTRRPIVRENAVGLDTGCVYGGWLTAFESRSGRIVQVAARKTYRKRSSRDYYDAGDGANQ